MSFLDNTDHGSRLVMALRNHDSLPAYCVGAEQIQDATFLACAIGPVTVKAIVPDENFHRAMRYIGRTVMVMPVAICPEESLCLAEINLST